MHAYYCQKDISEPIWKQVRKMSMGKWTKPALPAAWHCIKNATGDIGTLNYSGLLLSTSALDLHRF
jgi:hypothetical protein